MAHIHADRVADTTTTTGTGAVTVSGTAPTGYRTFSAVMTTNDTCYYAIASSSSTEWEVGLGTYSAANQITRTTVYASSNSNNAVNLSAGTKDIFITHAASRTVILNNSGNAVALGTPVSATLTNCTGLPISTGVSGLGSNVATFLATPSSANLASAVTDETGSGALVFATSPSLVTPVLGTPTSGNLTNCTADGTDKVGFQNIPQNEEDAAYTLVLADAGKHIYKSSATARTWTIPANSGANSVAFPVGTAVTFINTGTGNATIAITTDTLTMAGTGSTGSRTLSQWGVATAIKVTSTSWVITGTNLT